jgi:acyl-CoA synthetase (AMP-forming)/AMP-acid ligase II
MSGVMNLGRLLSQTAHRLPDRIGLAWGDRSWTWSALDRRVDALVDALRAEGVGKGDRILAHSRNSNQLIESLFAAFRLGAVWVPTNFRLTPAEVGYLGQSSGAKAMICGEAGFAAHVDAVRAASPALRTVVAVEAPRAGEHDYESLVARHMGAAPFVAEVEYGDPLWFFYTSGTTGRAKAAMLTHGQMAFVVNNHLADLVPGTGPDDASLVVAPLSHGAGVHLLPQVAKGAKTVLASADRFDEAECWRLVEAHRVSNMFTVPTILTRLVRHPAVDRYDHSSLRYVIYAGSPMYRADQKLALEKLGKVIVQYYGLGEVTGNITVLPRELHTMDDNAPDARIGSCGFPRTGMEVAIKDAEGRRLGPGVTGEICVRGPAVFAGYYDNPEANAKALKGGWLHTGDLGHLDEAGFLYITGRASDMYISGGSNVYPREIEEVLLTHPAVEEAAVLGVPDPRWGEAGVAVVVARAGAAVSAEALLAFLDGKLAKYKWPRHVVLWDALPKSGYGKVPKHLIRDELMRRGELGAAAGGAGR